MAICVDVVVEEILRVKGWGLAAISAIELTVDQTAVLPQLPPLYDLLYCLGYLDGASTIESWMQNYLLDVP